MQKALVVNGVKIPISFRKNTLSRSIKISINKKRGINVTIPIYGSYKKAEDFVILKKNWIYEHYLKIAESVNSFNSTDDYKLHKKAALILSKQRLSHFNKFYNFEYKKVSIRNQSTRWGSCSSRGTLSFNYRIVKLEPELADYLIVHELCHLKEMNHSKDFYDLIAKTIPNHKILQKRLKGKLD